MMRKISYGVILLLCLVMIGLAEFFVAGFDTDVFTRPSFWFTIIACGIANYIMLSYTAIEKIDNSLEKDEVVKNKKKELEDNVSVHVDTDFDDYLSVENRQRKINAWKTKISNKIAKLDEKTKDIDREVLWFGTDEDKENNSYCRERKALLYKLSDEYINRNIAFLRVKYVKLRRYEVTHGCKQKYDNYKLTTRRNLKIAIDNLPKIMQSLAFILMISTFTFDYKEFSILVLISFVIKLGSLCINIYNGITYGTSYITNTLLPDFQYRLNVIINYLNWKLKNKGGNANGSTSRL